MEGAAMFSSKATGRRRSSICAESREKPQARVAPAKLRPPTLARSPDSSDGPVRQHSREAHAESVVRGSPASLVYQGGTAAVAVPAQQSLPLSYADR
jgi:hypothetical protein